jgi:hydrogenase maturation protease
MTMKTLILGMGNTLLSDDGIGILIKRFLERKLSNTENVDFVETSWGGFRIIDLLRGYDYAIIVDSIKTAYKPQGYIYHLKPSDLLPTLRLTSYHDINFATALKLAQTFNEKIPAEIDIFAVEVENNLTISEHLSPLLWKSINECSELVAELLISKKIIHSNKAVKEIRKAINAELMNELYSLDKHEEKYNATLNYSN